MAEYYVAWSLLESGAYEAISFYFYSNILYITMKNVRFLIDVAQNCIDYTAFLVKSYLQAMPTNEFEPTFLLYLVLHVIGSRGWQLRHSFCKIWISSPSPKCFHRLKIKAKTSLQGLRFFGGNIYSLHILLYQIKNGISQKLCKF